MFLNNTQKNIRLWVNHSIGCGEEFELSSDQSHYLINVMRCLKGDVIKCFNVSSGEFRCLIVEANKHQVTVKAAEQIRTSEDKSDVWLIFSPLKKDKTDFVIEKAVELGVSKIIPIITERTNVKNVKIERYIAQAIEASEQCERLSVPDINVLITLKDLLDNWDKKRILYFADERRIGQKAINVFGLSKNCKSAILIGPEGGFSDNEASFIAQHSFVKNINLGPRILRAETAAVAALSVWQAAAGDWL